MDNQVLWVGGAFVASCVGCYAFDRWRANRPQYVTVTPEHQAAFKRWQGTTCEYLEKPVSGRVLAARLVNAETTREQMKRARAELFADRERRLAAMGQPAEEPAEEPTPVKQFPRKVG